MSDSVNAPDERAARAWLESFAAAVRARDPEGARNLVHDDASGFGTVVRRYEGADQLAEEQWLPVWERTASFAFDLATARFWHAGELVVAMSEWRSEDVSDDCSRRPRTGRATIVLEREGGQLRAAHTHFSLTPAP